MAGGRPPAFNLFTCPNCRALYHVVKVEAGPETDLARSLAEFAADLFSLAKVSSSSNTSRCEKRVAFKIGGANEKPRPRGTGLSQCVRFVRVTGETLLPHSVRMPSGSQTAREPTEPAQRNANLQSQWNCRPADVCLVCVAYSKARPGPQACRWHLLSKASAVTVNICAGRLTDDATRRTAE